jgi:hypothetical protein
VVRLAFTALWAAFGLAAPLAATAQVTNHAVVGIQGRNATRGYSSSLSIVFVSPAAYGPGCCVDSDSGEWKGPPYQSTTKGSAPAGDSSLSYGASFTRDEPSAPAAAQADLVQQWPQTSTSAVAVPHTVVGKQVGTIPGYLVATRSPSFPAQVEDALAFPLCRGLFVVAGFSALSPQQDSDHVGGTYLVNGQTASTWNAAQVTEAVRGVSVDGNLPPGRVVARAIGRSIVGSARDCIGQPLVGLTVRAVPGGAAARTSATGAFSIRVKKAGTYRIGASLAGVTASSGVVKVR